MSFSCLFLRHSLANMDNVGSSLDALAVGQQARQLLQNNPEVVAEAMRLFSSANQAPQTLATGAGLSNASTPLQYAAAPQELTAAFSRRLSIMDPTFAKGRLCSRYYEWVPPPFP